MKKDLITLFIYLKTKMCSYFRKERKMEKSICIKIIMGNSGPY